MGQTEMKPTIQMSGAFAKQVVEGFKRQKSNTIAQLKEHKANLEGSSDAQDKDTAASLCITIGFMEIELKALDSIGTAEIETEINLLITSFNQALIIQDQIDNWEESDFEEVSLEER